MNWEIAYLQPRKVERVFVFLYFRGGGSVVSREGWTGGKGGMEGWGVGTNLHDEIPILLTHLVDFTSWFHPVRSCVVDHSV